MRIAKTLFVLTLALALCGCGSIVAEDTQPASSRPPAQSIDFDSDDCAADFDPARAVAIALTGKSAECASPNVEINGDTVTIAKGGDYLLSGTLRGSLIVYADENALVRLILSDATIVSPTGVAIYVRSAGKAVITCAEGTQNLLSNDGEFIAMDENNVDSVVFSKDDLSFNGVGALAIEAAAGHGVVCKDSLRMVDANLTVSAASHAISAKDDIGIRGGSYVLSAGKDGLHAENKDNTALGNLLILSGSFAITADGDGISAENLLQIDGGTFEIRCGGGASCAPAHRETIPFRHSNADLQQSTSSKAVKAGGNLFLNGGSFNIDSADDALHSNTDLMLFDGRFSISSGDDALHADGLLGIYGGSLQILSSYEGLEGHRVEIYGGEIDLQSEDDGLNAAGSASEQPTSDDPFSADPEAYIHIFGGKLTLRCEGDGLDSNGEIRIDGGDITVFGPTNGGNASLDFGTAAYIGGGNFCALGASQMAEHFSESSDQCSLIAYLSGAAGSIVTLSDVSENILFSTVSENDFSCVLLSLEAFSVGESYTLAVDDQRIDLCFEATLFVYGNTRADRAAFGGRMRRQPTDLESPPAMDDRAVGNAPPSIEGHAPPAMNGMEPPDDRVPPSDPTADPAR